MIAKLEMTPGTAQQNMDQTQNPTNNRSSNKQWINNNRRSAFLKFDQKNVWTTRLCSSAIGMDTGGKKANR